MKRQKKPYPAAVFWTGFLQDLLRYVILLILALCILFADLKVRIIVLIGIACLLAVLLGCIMHQLRVRRRYLYFKGEISPAQETAMEKSLARRAARRAKKKAKAAAKRANPA